MGHADVKTTEIYTQVMEKDINEVKSPLDTPNYKQCFELAVLFIKIFSERV